MERFTGIDKLDLVLNQLVNARSRDQDHDALNRLAEIAPQYLPEIDHLYDTGEVYRMSLIWCLIGQRTDGAIQLFARALNDKDKYTRWAATEALSKCTTPRAYELLVTALKDRCHLVKGKAVDAMLSLRDPSAIPQLKKITESAHLGKTAPGIVNTARKALAACQRAS